MRRDVHQLGPLSIVQRHLVEERVCAIGRSQKLQRDVAAIRRDLGESQRTGSVVGMCPRKIFFPVGQSIAIGVIIRIRNENKSVSTARQFQ